MKLWPWSELKRLRLENERLEFVVTDQGQKINALRRVLAFFGFEVEIDD